MGDGVGAVVDGVRREVAVVLHTYKVIIEEHVEPHSLIGYVNPMRQHGLRGVHAVNFKEDEVSLAKARL